MNKNILKAIIIGAFTLTSCNNDLLNPYTPGSLTQEVAITTVNDLNLLLNSAYANVNSRSESEGVSIFTDEVGIGSSNGGQGISDDYIFQMTPDSFLSESIWDNNYFALSRINRVITFAGNVVTTNQTDADAVKRILAQAYSLRAYCHLQILAYYSTDMTSDTALAGVLADKVVTAVTSKNLQRNTNKEFYTLIQGDLDKAVALFDATGTTTVNKVAANKFFALGLKARAFEYRGDYPNAEIFANRVINESGLILANDAVSYQQIFFTDNELGNVETIFRLKRVPSANGQGYNLHNAWVSIRPNATGSAFYEISRALFNKVAANPNPVTGVPDDVRYRTMVAPSSTIDPNYATSPDYRNTDVLIINKHGGVATGTNTAAVTQTNGFNNDIKIMRLSEMYLIRAEARVVASDLPGAATAVNVIKKARLNTVPAAYASPQVAWKGILDERRIEFAYEGYRFIDLKRIGTKAGSGIDRNPADYSSSSANYPGGNPANLPLTSYKFALPIPRSELNANQVITQNPGY